MPTERKRAVRTAAAWAADQAAMEALYGVNGYYTLPSLWEAGEQDNLVNLDQIRTAVCYNDWPSGLDDNVTVAGWTTDATRYVKITVAEGHRHNGTPMSGFYMRATGDLIAVVRVQQNYTWVEWLDLGNSSTSTTASALTLNNNTSVAEKLVLTCNSSRQVCVLGSGALRASLIYGGVIATSPGAYVGGTLENCVVANMSGYGVGLAETSGFGPTVKNCVFYNCAGGPFSVTPYDKFKAESTNNASSGTSGLIGANPVYSVASSDFVNAASNDFHLTSGSVLRGAGVNLYSDFTTDIDGDEWPSSGAWDIGFDYYVAAGGSLTIDSITASNITSSSARITLGLTR